MLEKLPGLIGHVLREQRAGLDQLSFNLIPLRGGTSAIEVRSLAFVDHAAIPARYTADGEGLSPPLQWSGIPASAESVLLIVEDADSPTPHPLVHAIVVGLPAQDQSLAEGALKGPDRPGNTDLQAGRNSLLQAGWLPPDPLPGHGRHRYAFQVFALAPGASFEGNPGREAVLAALQQHALASGCLIGSYERPDGSVRDSATALMPLGPRPA